MEERSRPPVRDSREYGREYLGDGPVLDELERLARYCPEVLQGHMALRQAALAGPPHGVLPLKYKELICVGIECAIRRTAPPPTFHARKAIDAGATPHEVAEVVALCTMLRGIGTFWESGRHALRAAEERARELAGGVAWEKPKEGSPRPPLVDTHEYERQYYLDQSRLEHHERLARYCPGVLDGYMVFRQGVFMEPPHGALPLKIKELVVVAIECAVLKTNRPPVFHAQKAIDAGATPHEVAESVSLCILLAGMITYAESGRWALQVAIERATETADDTAGETRS